MSNSNIRQVTPMLHVPDFGPAFNFFTKVLGFEALFRVSTYAYLEREGAGARVLEERGRAVVPIENARTTVYFDVRDVDALYAELKPRLEGLPAEDVQAPRNQHWRQRELLVRLPDGNWLAFGQPVKD